MRDVTKLKLQTMKKNVKTNFSEFKIKKVIKQNLHQLIGFWQGISNIGCS